MSARLLLAFLLLAPALAGAAEPSRAEVLTVLTASPAVPAQPAPEAAPAPTGAKPTLADKLRPFLPPEAAAPDEHTPFIEAAERMATAEADREMTDALLAYMLTHRSPESTVPARALGRVFVEQTDTFVAAYKAQPVVAQVAVWPYFEFGYNRALQGKNRSIMKYKRAQKRFDALSAAMMNAGR